MCFSHIVHLYSMGGPIVLLYKGEESDHSILWIIKISFFLFF